MGWGFQRKASENELQDKLEKLENRFQTLRAEFGELADIVYRNLQRLAKLNSNMVKAAEGQDGEPAAHPSESPTEQTRSGRLLTTRQMSIQQEILRRRAGG